MSEPPVLLLHGFGTSFASTWVGNGWTALLEDAGRDFIAVDLLGHGTAPKPHDPDAYRDLEEHVMAALPEEPVDAIGFSWWRESAPDSWRLTTGGQRRSSRP